MSFNTNVEVEFNIVGFTLHTRLLLLFGISKHGSLMPLPTAQRHASARNGAAMELVQQEPLSTGVELAGGGGVYAMTCVAGTALALCVEVEVVRFGAAVIFEPAKNCPTPNSTTSASTTTTIILFPFFICVKGI